MPLDQNPKHMPWELAEAEATSDVTDTEAAGDGTLGRRAAEMPARPGATDTELAHAECESDLSHSEPAR
jgi:hypothetical protein